LDLNAKSLNLTTIGIPLLDEKLLTPEEGLYLWSCLNESEIVKYWS
jgi:hypothetical protein